MKKFFTIFHIIVLVPKVHLSSISYNQRKKCGRPIFLEVCSLSTIFDNVFSPPYSEFNYPLLIRLLKTCPPPNHDKKCKKHVRPQNEQTALTSKEQITKKNC